MTTSATSLTRHGMKMTAPTSTIRSCCRTASRSIPRRASCPGKSMFRRCWASSTAASVTRACSSQALSSRRFSSPCAVSCLLQAWPPHFRRTARPSRPCVPLQSPGKGPRPAARMPASACGRFDQSRRQGRTAVRATSRGNAPSFGCGAVDTANHPCRKRTANRFRPAAAAEPRPLLSHPRTPARGHAVHGTAKR